MPTLVLNDDYKDPTPSQPSSKMRQSIMRTSSWAGSQVMREGIVVTENPAPLRVVADADAMKEQVRKNLLRPRYNVADLYHREGAFQAIARSQMFENITLLVIACNALWIAIDTDMNGAQVLLDAQPVFQIMEHFFCTYFSLELTIRFLSFRRKRSCLTDAWFVFDSCLVFLMIAETWVMTSVMILAGAGGSGGLGNASILRMARLLRLSRMARMVRLLRAMPELLILIKGMVAATRSVFFTLCLLTVLLYVFGIALRQLTEGTDSGDEFFPSVPMSMYSLLLHATFIDNLGDCVDAVAMDSVICVLLIWVFILVGPLTVLNMLIGVLCEVVSAVAATEREAIVVSFTKEKMAQLFEDLDRSGDGLISREEFLGILQKPEATRLLEEVGVDAVGLVDQADAIFTETIVGQDGEMEERKLTFLDLMGIILELRGTNHASVKHIVELRKYVLAAIAQTNRTLARLEGAILHSEGGTVRRKDARSESTDTSRDRKDKGSDSRRAVVDPPTPKPERISELPRLDRSDVEVQDFEVTDDLSQVIRTTFFGHPFGINPAVEVPVVPQWIAAPQVAEAKLMPTSFPPPPVPAGFSGVDLQGLVDRLEGIISEARAEIHRELGRSNGIGPAPRYLRPPGLGEVPSAGQQVACVLNMREWEELRAKLAGIAGTVAGVAELRRIGSQLEEEERHRAPKGHHGSFGSSKVQVWKPDA